MDKQTNFRFSDLQSRPDRTEEKVLFSEPRKRPENGGTLSFSREDDLFSLQSGLDAVANLQYFGMAKNKVAGDIFFTAIVQVYASLSLALLFQTTTTYVQTDTDLRTYSRTCEADVCTAHSADAHADARAHERAGAHGGGGEIESVTEKTLPTMLWQMLVIVCACVRVCVSNWVC